MFSCTDKEKYTEGLITTTADDIFRLFIGEV